MFEKSLGDEVVDHSAEPERDHRDDGLENGGIDVGGVGLGIGPPGAESGEPDVLHSVDEDEDLVFHAFAVGRVVRLGLRLVLGVVLRGLALDDRLTTSCDQLADGPVARGLLQSEEWIATRWGV